MLEQVLILEVSSMVCRGAQSFSRNTSSSLLPVGGRSSPGSSCRCGALGWQCHLKLVGVFDEGLGIVRVVVEGLEHDGVVGFRP